MIVRYSRGMFILIRTTEETKYIPMIWASNSTMIVDDFELEIA